MTAPPESPFRPPHAPEPTWGRRLLGDFHITGLFWYRFHRWAIGHIPEFLLTPIVYFFTAFFFLTIWRIRAAIGSNLEAVLGPTHWLGRQRRIWRTMINFAWCLTERYERLMTSRVFEVLVEDQHHWDAVLGGGSGFIMVTAHLGLYEVGSMIPAGKDVPHVHLVREPEVDPRAQAFVKQTVAATQNAHYTMHFQTGDPLFALTLIEALQRGEVLAIQGDRPRTGGKTVEVNAFGRTLELPAGPAILARTAQVPLFPVFAVREGRRRFRLLFRPAIRVPRTRDRDADMRIGMAAVAAEIEAAVRQAPYQWFVFRRLWPTHATQPAK